VHREQDRVQWFRATALNPDKASTGRELKRHFEKDIKRERSLDLGASGCTKRRNQSRDRRAPGTAAG
jgi:hypothetical protein